MNKSETEIKLEEILDKFCPSENSNNFSDTKNLFDFKEGKIKVFDSYWSYINADSLSSLDNAEYFILENLQVMLV